MLVPDYQIDIDWLHKISYKLPGFKKVNVSGTTFVSRCIYCGDSERSTKIKRLYFYTKKGNLNFDCKNCGAHGSFWTFMKEQCTELFEDYKKQQILERFQRYSSSPSKPTNSNKQQKFKTPSSNTRKASIVGCTRIDRLDSDHYAYQYVKDRQIPEEAFSRLYFSEDFKKTAEAISPDPLSEKFPREPRLVIPFFSKDGSVEMIQGRSFDPDSGLRYISIKSSEDIDKIYGKENIDKSKTVYCVEGPLDSLFVDNCLATCDSSLHRSNADVLIFDNQPRSKEIVKLMEQAITDKRKIVIWPVSPDEKIDINNMIKMGLSKLELIEIIERNTFSGLKAKLAFTKWKKV
jgi:hypothetical protein